MKELLVHVQGNEWQNQSGCHYPVTSTPWSCMLHQESLCHSDGDVKNDFVSSLCLCRQALLPVQFCNLIFKVWIQLVCVLTFNPMFRGEALGPQLTKNAQAFWIIKYYLFFMILLLLGTDFSKLCLVIDGVNWTWHSMIVTDDKTKCENHILELNCLRKNHRNKMYWC